MGLFSRKPKKIEPPLLYQGRLIETKLYPVNGQWEQRNAALGPAGRKNLWCKLQTGTTASGKYAGSTFLQAIVEGHVVGEISAQHLAKSPDVVAALNSGINAATVFLEHQGDSIHATLRLGNHQYMPRPYWE